jgi:hypothetical protein
MGRVSTFSWTRRIGPASPPQISGPSMHGWTERQATIDLLHQLWFRFRLTGRRAIVQTSHTEFQIALSDHCRLVQIMHGVKETFVARGVRHG